MQYIRRTLFRRWISRKRGREREKTGDKESDLTGDRNNDRTVFDGWEGEE